MLALFLFYQLTSRFFLQGLIFADANAIKENCAKLGVGDDLYALFAGILTMRPWNRVIDPSLDHLVIQGNDGDRSDIQVIIHQRMWISQKHMHFTKCSLRVSLILDALNNL